MRAVIPQPFVRAHFDLKITHDFNLFVRFAHFFSCITFGLGRIDNGQKPSRRLGMGAGRTVFPFRIFHFRHEGREKGTQAMHSAPIHINRDSGVQIIRIYRPEKKNALTGEMYDTMSEALERANTDADIAASIFFGAEGMFTAGNDISEFLAMGESGAMGEPILRFLDAVAQSRKPLIAGIDGLAVGIGTTMLFHFDLVYASPTSRFRTPFLNLGLVPEAASSLLAPRRMGYVWAFELLCLGEEFDAERAEACGLVNAVVPAAQLEAMAVRAARKIANLPQEALALSRDLLRGDRAEVIARMNEESALFAERLKSPEAREAFTAFLEKRPPDFSRVRKEGK